MKKILSFALAAAAAMHMCISGVAAAETSVVKKTYSVTELASFTPPIAEGSTSTSSRSFGIETYQNGNNIYAYVHTRYDGLKVYDVTDPENIGAPIQTLTNINAGDRSLSMRIEVCGDKLYVGSSNDNKVHCMNINSDGTLDVNSDRTTTYPATYMDSADGLVFAAQNNTKSIHVLNTESETPEAAVDTYTDTAESCKNTRALEVRKLDNSTYRMAYVLQQTDTIFEINVVDYNPAAETDKFTLVCEKVYSDWTNHGFWNIAFLSDTTILVPYYSANKVKYYTVDFAECITKADAECTITMEQEQSANTYNVFIQAMNDGEVAAWHSTSYIKDFSGDTVADIASTTAVGNAVCDADITGDVNSEKGAVVYLAVDSKVIIANVKRNSVTEEAYINTNVVDKTAINPGEVTTITTDGVRLKTSVAAKVGEKTVVYGMDSKASGALKAFDVTDGKTATQLGNAVTYSDTQSAPMYVKNNNLIFGSANNVTVVALNDDGSIGNQVFANSTGNSVADLEVVDDLLFASSLNANNGVTIYDISAPTSNTKPLATIKTDAGVRSLAVEKISNIRYRIYIATRDDANKTLKLTIKDFIYALGSTSVEDIFDAATPSCENGLSWIGGNNGYIDVVKAGYIVAEYNNLGRFVVDVTNPSAPKVVNVIDNSSNNGEASCRRRKVNLDSTKVVEITWSFADTMGTYIMDYSNPAAPELLAQIAIAANGASIVDNYLYTTEDGAIKVVKLYDKTVEKVVTYSDMTFDKAAVADADTTASITVTNNTDSAVTPTLIIALYDKDGSLVSVNPVVGNVAGNSEGTISATILADSIPTDTTGHYFKAMLWKDMQSLEPIVDFETLGK